jgi:hypothetical protein
MAGGELNHEGCSDAYSLVFNLLLDEQKYYTSFFERRIYRRMMCALRDGDAGAAAEGIRRSRGKHLWRAILAANMNMYNETVLEVEYIRCVRNGVIDLDTGRGLCFAMSINPEVVDRTEYEKFKRKRKAGGIE